MNDTLPHYKGVIFDLDGTLLDTAEGVLSSVRHAIDTMGYTPLSDEVMRTFIGPPVKRSLLATYHLSEEEACQATEVFRNHYKDYDLLKAVPYEGIMDFLNVLKSRGIKIGVATLKRDDYSHTLLEHFHIAEYCDSICGSDMASKMLKIDVLDQCMDEMGLPNDQVVLIGDTSSDGEGAQQAGIDFIAVTYGFGYRTKEEWSRFHPVFTASHVSEIIDFLNM
ncbi:MAG: HAD hydrolase-like protein [Clostridium sp.]